MARIVDAAYAVGAQYLVATVRRVTCGAYEASDDQVTALGYAAMAASRTLDDAVRHYLSESSGSTDRRAPVIRAANRAVRLRTAAELIADVVPPPLTAYPRVRRVLELHTASVCERLGGANPDAQYGPISDDFVLALRAESDGSALSISAALPLVAVAASLGELELLYPEPVTPLDYARRARVITPKSRGQGWWGISAFGGMRPNRPALKSSSACTTSAFEFMTNGP